MMRASCLLVALALAGCGSRENKQPTPADVNKVATYEKEKEIPGEAGRGDHEPNRQSCIMQCKADEQNFYLECMRAHANHSSAEQHCRNAAAAANSTCEADRC